MAEIIGRECKFVIHLPMIPGVREDTHYIKETIHYDDKTLKDNIRLLTNYRRPFWVTKPHYQNHKQKKESELLEKVNQYTSTDSELGRNIASRLGSKYNGITSLRDVVDSPFLYGADVKAATVIKKLYMDKYPYAISPYTLATLDIETNVETDLITMVSLVMKDKVHTVVTKQYLLDGNVNPKDLDKQVDYLYNKYVPECEIKNAVKRTLTVVNTEMDLVYDVFAKAHLWQPDILAVWNIEFDIPRMVDVCHKYRVDPADVFSDPNIPKNLRHFTYKQGMKQHVTESGKFKPINPEEQWHSVITPASFYIIDAMSGHRYVRVGGKTTPGGYSLDNILLQELGSKLQKLKFETETKYKGVEWHLYMTKNKPLEYIVYNMWDCMSMIELDKKTKDLSTVLPMLAGPSSFSIFNSGPKKIVDAMHFYYLSKGSVLGVKESRMGDDKILGLSDWI